MCVHCIRYSTAVCTEFMKYIACAKIKVSSTVIANVCVHAYANEHARAHVYNYAFMPFRVTYAYVPLILL